jgi:hypothetical protein
VISFCSDTELPARAEITAMFESAGFARITHQVVRQTIAPDWPSLVEKSALRGDSFLAWLSDNENFAPAWTRCRRMATASTCLPPSENEPVDLFGHGTGREMR